jgi:hypothetical protein
MGKRSRAKARETKLAAPVSDYTSPSGDVLTLRGAMTPKTRAQYAATLSGNVLSQEDAWHRAVEFLFERLAVRWVVSDVATEGQRGLLMRFRVATQDERRWIRDVLREHLAEHFPELQAP